MKILSALVILLSVASLSQAQINAKTGDGRDVILENDGTWHYAQSQTPQPLFHTVSSDCDKYQVGDIRLTNQSQFQASGRICFRVVDKQSKDINSLFCEEFTLEPDSSVYYSDVLNGAVQLRYGFYTPDQSQPSGFAYGSVRSVTDSAVICKVREIGLQVK